MKELRLKKVNKKFIFHPLFLFFFFWSLEAHSQRMILTLSLEAEARSSRAPKMFCGQIFLSSRPSVLSLSTPPPSVSSIKVPDSTPSRETVSPDSVVIDFVKRSLGEGFTDKMGDGWIKKAKASFKKWETEDVRRFLNEMESRIGREDTVERLRYLSYFSSSGYRSFSERVAFFERYMGEQGVAGRLRRSLGLFLLNKPLGVFEEVAVFLEPYVGREVVGQIMERSPEKFSKINLVELREIVNYAEPRLGREALGEIMGNDFFGFFETLSYRYKSVDEIFDALAKLEDSWKETEREIGEVFLEENLSGNRKGDFYTRFGSTKNGIHRQIEDLVGRMSNDTNKIRAFEVNTTELMISTFFRTFMEDVLDLRTVKGDHRTEGIEKSRDSKERSLFEINAPYQISSEKPYSFNTVDGRDYSAVFGRGYLSELEKANRTSPEYFSKVLNKLFYGVHGGSSRESGVIFLGNHGIFEVRLVGGKNNGFRSYGYIRGNVLYFLRLSRENGHSSRTIARERDVIKRMMLQMGGSLH